MTKLAKKAIRYGRMYGRTDPNYRKASLLKSKALKPEGRTEKINVRIY